jgi:hypothetical protein
MLPPTRLGSNCGASETPWPGVVFSQKTQI